jgi:hypothetical protein
MSPVQVLTSVWVLSILWPSCAVAQACRDIAKFDFRNSVIRGTGNTGEHNYGLFNGPGPDGAFRFRDGVFLEWDLPPQETASPSAAERKQPVGRPDWETTIEQDKVWRPGGSSDLRVLALNKSHSSGTGAFNYIFVFECNAGSVRKVFEGSGEGVRLERTTADGIEISVGLWGKEDAHCCPSRVVRLRYSWAPRQHRFIRKEANSEAPWLP